eukprot:TRINITY_DN2657_c0_g1_i1.p1 TRINITY_DN2657_c0_g1~~TRINITY_DN2657_c0_g1_i1.p1  ORF type:complete len:156 (+),score=2.54 TRINITY_DN2657_c0_g1_i1:98-565(+)
MPFVGAFNNQSSEHLNKFIKRCLLRNVMKNNSKYLQTLTHETILSLLNLDTNPEPVKACKTCSRTDHRVKTNKRCPYYVVNPAHQKAKDQYKKLFKQDDPIDLDELLKLAQKPIAPLAALHTDDLGGSEESIITGTAILNRAEGGTNNATYRTHP